MYRRDTYRPSSGASCDAAHSLPHRQQSRGPVPRGRGTWTDAQLAAAILDVEKGAAIRTTARFHQIPTSSLRDHLYGSTTNEKRG
jgi:hypothetical protein